MGIDVSFSKSAADRHNLFEYRTVRNSSEESAKFAEMMGDKEHADWCREESPVCRLQHDGNSGWRQYDVQGDVMIIRANHWGKLYEPLTKALMSRAIPWEEA